MNCHRHLLHHHHRHGRHGRRRRLRRRFCICCHRRHYDHFILFASCLSVPIVRFPSPSVSPLHFMEPPTLKKVVNDEQ